MNKVLVPLDGSALAESAIAAVVDIVRPGGITVILLRGAERDEMGRDGLSSPGNGKSGAG